MKFFTATGVHRHIAGESFMNACPNRASSTPLLPRGVRRALDAMRTNVGRDWSVTELAEAAGLSSRTLQRQFREFVGKAPRAALRDIRFETARRELLQGMPDAKVMDVARALRIPALRTVFRRVSPPFWRNAVADREAAGGVRRCAERRCRRLPSRAAIGPPSRCARSTPARNTATSRTASPMSLRSP